MGQKWVESGSEIVFVLTKSQKWVFVPKNLLSPTFDLFFDLLSEFPAGSCVEILQKFSSIVNPRRGGFAINPKIVQKSRTNIL